MHTALSRPRRPPPRSHFPQALGVPLPYRYFPSVNSAFCARARRCYSKGGGRGQGTASTPSHPGYRQSPFFPDVSSLGRAATPAARGRRKQARRKPLGVGTTLPVLGPITLPGPLDSSRITGITAAKAPNRKEGATTSQVWRGELGGRGGPPYLAAGRRKLVPRCEAQWAWPSGPHDLHFALKKAGQGAGA